MGFLNRIFGTQLSDLVTCVIIKDGDGIWEANTTDNTTPGKLTDTNLDTVADKVAQAVAECYRHSPKAAMAELKFAIYPWGKGSKIDVTLQITKSERRFTAGDRRGNNLVLSGTSLEELISNASAQLTNPDTAMLQWILPINELTYFLTP